jgi:PAS domain S-box-containing protein
LLLVARRRRDLVFPWAFDLFALFILACGATHFMSIVTLWQPAYGLQGAVKAATAAVSVATAVALWPLLPRILALPSHGALADANASLLREVAERREAEHRARDSEARLAGFFEHLADALFVVRVEPGGFVFETVNPSFCRLFGQDRATIEGAGPDALLDAPAAVELIREFTACLVTRQPRDWENAAPAAGQQHWHTVLVPLPEAADGFPRLLGSLRDVTELRRLQTDLVETARRATIGAMCAGVAHEMSQPVNIIGLWTDRALAAQDSGKAVPRRALEVVLGQSRRLGILLERMRDLTRNAPDGAETFCATALVGAAVDVAQRAWGLEPLDLALRPAAPARVRGRPAQLEQAVLHLLENARDAIRHRRRQEPDAPARITVSLQDGPTPGTIAITLCDTGGGVPAGLGAHILEPFVTSKDPGQGTGLGLPIAAGIARGMGGRLSWANRAEGKPEAGAVFRLILPLAGPETEEGQAVA